MIDLHMNIMLTQKHIPTQAIDLGRCYVTTEKPGQNNTVKKIFTGENAQKIN